MALSARARIEVYVPDLPTMGYRELVETLAREFTFAFGGCSIVRGIEGYYLSEAGAVIPDRVTLIYTDAPFSLERNRARLAHYAAELKAAAFEALEEEAILVVVTAVHHASS